jgi:hypothetical protein
MSTRRVRRGGSSSTVRCEVRLSERQEHEKTGGLRNATGGGSQTHPRRTRFTEIVENVLAEHRFIERSRNPYVANDNQRTYILHPCFLYMIDPACSSGRLLVRQRRSAPTRAWLSRISRREPQEFNLPAGMVKTETLQKRFSRPPGGGEGGFSGWPSRVSGRRPTLLHPGTGATGSSRTQDGCFVVVARPAGMGPGRV